MSEIDSFKNHLNNIFTRYPDRDSYYKRVDKVLETLLFEDISIRDRDRTGSPGGIIRLKKNISTIVVPDLHGRDYFLMNILNHKFRDKTVLEELFSNEVQIVCVGDGFHGERRVRDRWLLSALEYSDNFKKHDNIDKEMDESLTLMAIVMELKIKFPDNFHFLKGNHENILNEEGDGNYPFGKFTTEGAIVREWTEKFFGEDFLYKYSTFEKSLPLFAIGRNFIISHAEPMEAYSEDELINCYEDSRIIFGLTWTRNGQATEDSVEKLLEKFIEYDQLDGALYIVGHTSIRGKYNIGAGGLLVQLHNPDRCQVLYIDKDIKIDLERDIGEING